MSMVLEQPARIDSPVSAIMGPSFPTVDIRAPIDDVVRLMTSKKNSAVLITENGTVTGILTRYDVIEFLGK